MRKLVNDKFSDYIKLSEDLSTHVDKVDDYEEEGDITKEELLGMLEDMDDYDVNQIAMFVFEYIEDVYGDDMEDDMDDSLEEKTDSSAKKQKAKLMRMKPGYKKAQKKKARCKLKYADRLAATADKNIPQVCGNDGKLHKGRSKKERKIMAKKKRKQGINK